MAVNIRFAARSDVGLVRKNNQDGGYAGSHLLILADGMGGAAGGDTASSVTIGHLAPLDDVHRAEDLLPKLRQAVTEAHDDLVEMAREDESLAGMGTTCIAILRAGNKLAMIHIGDSRAYLLRGNQLIQVTKDHTLVQYLLDHGQITAEQAENHPKKNVIMKALGDSEGDVELDESVREAVVGDRWLLSSDGLFGVVSNETIADTLLNYEDLDECADKLIDLALAGGAPDNVTVVLADIVDPRDGPGDTTPIIVGSAAADYDKPSRAGTSAAGKAAALKEPPEKREDKDNDGEEGDQKKRRRWPARLGVFLGIVVILGGALFGTYMWTQSQYYVYTDNGRVVIYQGVPQKLGPISLSSEVEKTDVELTDLSQTARARLQTPVTRSSLEEAESYVRDLKENYTKAPTPPSTRRSGGGESAVDDPTETSSPSGDTGGESVEQGASPEPGDAAEPEPTTQIGSGVDPLRKVRTNGGLAESTESIPTETESTDREHP